MLPITLANVQLFCRVCLRELSSCKQNQSEKENLDELLENIAGVQTDKKLHQSYPKNVCDSCFIKMVALNSFRQKAIINFGVLKMILLENLKETTLSKLKSFCRVCLKNSNDKSNGNNSLKLLADIGRCCGISQGEGTESGEHFLADDEHLPQTLCCKCSSKLETFMTFRSLAQQSAAYLNNFLEGEGRIKVENEAASPDTLQFSVEKECNEGNLQMKWAQQSYFSCDSYNEQSDFSPSHVKIEYCQIKLDNDDFIKNDEPLMPIFESHKVDEIPLSNILQIDKNIIETSDLNRSNSTEEIEEEVSIEIKSPKDNENAQENEDIKKNSKTALICPNCERTFYKLITYEAHIKAAHEGVERPFACKHCPSTFRQNSALDRHIALLHAPKEPLPLEVDIFAQPRPNIHVCMTCLKQFKRKDSLEQHINTAHTDIELRPFKCQICQKGFGSRRTMLRHQNNHSKERPFACEFCPKRYNTKADFTSHMQRHTTNPELLCPICKRGKSNVEELQKHIAMHEASRQHQCMICGRVFKKLFHLREHESVVHLKLRPFKCTYCDKTFGTRRTQKEHELLHDSSARPIYCYLCSMNFKTEGTLSRHMSKDHNQPPKNLKAKNNLKAKATIS